MKVWVPTEADANDVRKLAAERRRIATAIAEHGSAAYITPSGAVLDLMTTLSEEDDLIAFSCAFIILARAKPANAGFVASAAPAKISNFLIRHRGVSAPAFLKWTNKNPGWADDLEDAVRDPERFKQVVKDMAVAIKTTKD